MMKENLGKGRDDLGVGREVLLGGGEGSLTWGINDNWWRGDWRVSVNDSSLVRNQSPHCPTPFPSD